MQRPAFIARQAACAAGLLGRALGTVMAMETRALNDEVLRRLAITPGERILEIGFGHGRTLERAAKANLDARFAGIDHASDMVAALARRCAAITKTGRLELQSGDSRALPWLERSFDGVYAVHILYFWRSPDRDLAEVWRVLRPGGRLVLGFQERTPEAQAAFPADVYRFRSQEEVATLLSDAGLTAHLSPGPRPGLWVAEGRLA